MGMGAQSRERLLSPPVSDCHKSCAETAASETRTFFKFLSRLSARPVPAAALSSRSTTRALGTWKSYAAPCRRARTGGEAAAAAAAEAAEAAAAAASFLYTNF